MPDTDIAHDLARHLCPWRHVSRYPPLPTYPAKSNTHATHAPYSLQRARCSSQAFLCLICTLTLCHSRCSAMLKPTMRKGRSPRQVPKGPT
eukprot:816108-Rhodomonas_salina.4